jgi:predicted AlkP superfamily phosphohydrolase/phosphomutase/tetratricopeptide (TPR) repeat protein
MLRRSRGFLLLRPKSWILIGAAIVLIGLSWLIGFTLGRRASSRETVETKIADGIRQKNVKKVILIGIDGAEWEMVNRLIRESKLPHLSRLIQSGVHGDLKSLEPILSPVIWTSIVTGVTPEKHGINWFMVRDEITKETRPVTSTQREVKAIWNILSEKNLSVGIIGWWATWPAEQVKGFIISDYVAYHGFGLNAQEVKTEEGKTYPPGLIKEIEPLLLDPFSMSQSELASYMEVEKAEYDTCVSKTFSFSNPLHHFMYSIATMKSYASITKKLHKEYQPDFMAVYFEGVDSVGHLFMKYAPPQMDGLENGLYRKYSKVLENTYILQDQMVGEIVKEAGPNTLFVVVSDHGFKMGKERLKELEFTDIRNAHLWHKISGIFIASGPGIKRGDTLAGGSVLDITPTILYAMGLPMASDMDGKPLMQAFTDEFRKDNPLTTIRSYMETGTTPMTPPEAPRAINKEIEEKLRSLGYLGGKSDDSGVRLNRANAYYKKGELDKALGQLEIVLKNYPDNLSALGMRLELCKKKGNDDEVLKTGERIIRIMPEKVENQEQQKLYTGTLSEVGRIYFQRGEMAKSAQSYKKALAIEPMNAEHAYNLGVTLEQSASMEEAVQSYREAVRVNPRHAQALNNLAACLQKMGKGEEAIGYYREAITNRPGFVEARYNLSLLLAKMRRFDESINELRKLTADYPNSALYHFSLAEVLFLAERYKDSVEEYALASRLEPNNARNWHALANAEEKAGMMKEAGEHRQKALSIK